MFMRTLFHLDGTRACVSSVEILWNRLFQTHNALARQRGQIPVYTVYIERSRLWCWCYSNQCWTRLQHTLQRRIHISLIHAQKPGLLDLFTLRYYFLLFLLYWWISFFLCFPFATFHVYTGIFAAVHWHYSGCEKIMFEHNFDFWTRRERQKLYRKLWIHILYNQFLVWKMKIEFFA